MEDHYNKADVVYDEDRIISVGNFPVEGVELVVSGRIDFNFTNHSFFDYLKYSYREEIREASPGIRFFWNYYRINIYVERSYKVEVSQEGLEDIVNKYFHIVDNTKKIIDVACQNYRTLR
ncbi:MAG: hypothetical protein WBB45_15830 [Cyclobacteriaceae bacterium]